tara:strand:+ start:306 stop:455 length:150 start_codon:yes stop_codon:yes gene_type:complete
VYKYIKGKSVVELMFEGLAVGLTALFIVGWTTMIYHIVVNGATANFGIY